MNPVKVFTLPVPGARLHYEVAGSGPVLLMISGAPGDAAMFSGLSQILAGRYTVITYDLRGISRSSLTGTPADQPVQVHSDDAHRILAAIGGDEPAYVLGCSGGALIGLDLAVRHPGQVRALVAHEPPATSLLPDAPRWSAFFQDVYDTYRSGGTGPAMQKFGEGTGLAGDQHAGEAEAPFEPAPEMLEMMARFDSNLSFFFGHLLRPAMAYVPDVAALRTAPCRIVIAAGDASGGQLPHDAAAELAKRLGTQLVEFPGDHGGFTTHPQPFAKTLHEILQEPLS